LVPGQDFISVVVSLAPLAASFEPITLFNIVDLPVDVIPKRAILFPIISNGLVLVAKSTRAAVAA
jgi:hypothetical protein